MFITFEGINCSGKTTQAKKLFNFFKKQNKDVILTKEPGGGGEFCMEIRRIICRTKDISKFTELFLLYASRCEHINKVIQPSLNEGKIVICDRYIDSSFAYQCCDDWNKIDFVKKMHKEIGGLMPDITFFIDISALESEYRLLDIENNSSNTAVGYKKFDHLEVEQMQKIVNTYRKIAKEDSKRIKTINGTLSENEISKKIIDILKMYS